MLRTGGICKISFVMQVGDSCLKNVIIFPHVSCMYMMTGMIPYPEPYQSMYQRRRLGALGIEWRPSSFRFSIGTDFNMDQPYQTFPIIDLEMLIEPLPGFVDAMDWEPEIEIQSDESDSEYHVTEEYSSGKEHGSFCSDASANPENSDEDSEAADNQKDALRRSRRKKQKEEVKGFYVILHQHFLFICSA